MVPGTTGSAIRVAHDRNHLLFREARIAQSPPSALIGQGGLNKGSFQLTVAGEIRSWAAICWPV
jgi:hypothetical protein